MNENTESPITFFQQAIYSASPPARLPDGMDQKSIDFYNELLAMRDFIKALGQGDLSGRLPMKGYLAGILKALQSNLRHMTWQTQRIAEGDFDQHLDFLGEFSTSFNKMTLQLKEIQQTLSMSEAHYRKLTETMLDVICTIDVNTLRPSFVSPSILPLSGYRHEEIMDMSFQDLFSEKSAAHMQQVIETYKTRLAKENNRENDYQCTFEVQLKKKDNSLIWTEIIAHFVWEPHTEEVFINAVMRDITKRKDIQDKLKIQATMDDLTRIPNRRYFLRCAETQFQQCQRSGQSMCFLMMDIDHFKKVNDTWGHSVGDTILQMVSSSCKNALRSRDKIGRLGGEEFGVFMPETNLDQGIKAAERIRKKVEKEARITYCGSLIQMTISIGIAELYHETDSLHSLLIRADSALYTAKAKGRNQICHSSEIPETDHCLPTWYDPENDVIDRKATH